MSALTVPLPAFMGEACSDMSIISCTRELPVGYLPAPCPIRERRPIHLPTRVVMLPLRGTALSGASGLSRVGSTKAAMRPFSYFFALTSSLHTLPRERKLSTSSFVMCRMPKA